jgi:hypothetical protein
VTKNASAGQNDANRSAVYQQLCSSYHQIDDFRSKLLALLPFASAAGLFLLLNDKFSDPLKVEAAKPFLVPIGIFGSVVHSAYFLTRFMGSGSAASSLMLAPGLKKSWGSLVSLRPVQTTLLMNRLLPV